MDLHHQARDGNPQDIVGQDHSSQPTDERVFGAQGRRRASWRVDDRTRQFFEEDKDFDTALQAVEVDMDSVDASDHRLFTLAVRQQQQLESGSATFPAVIRVDRIDNAAAPATLQSLSFPATDNPLFLRTIPDANKLLLLTATELRIYDYDNSSLTLDVNLAGEPVPIGVASIPTGSTACTGHSFGTLRGAEVAFIQVPGGEERMALVHASIAGTNCLPEGKPVPSGLLVANLDDFANPFFYASDLAKQSWDPCRTSTDQCVEWWVGGFAHVRTTGVNPRDLVYAVGGTEVDLRELDVTGVSDPNTGIVELGTYELNPADTLCSVVADPEAPASNDYLYVVGSHLIYTVDRSNLGGTGFVASTYAGFGNGPAGDAHFMLAPASGSGPDLREIWTLAMQQARYVFRVSDFTQDGVGALDAPDASEGYYSAGPTDGGVANFFWESVYLPTFGGVVRWDISGTEPIPVVSSYQPAHDSTTLLDYTTEHLELADLGDGVTASWRLLAPTAQGNFYAWPLDGTTHDPLPGAIFQPSPSYWPSWSNLAYGNDIAVGVHPTNGDKFIFVDYSDPTAGAIGIGGYNWTDGTWGQFSALTWTDPSPSVAPNIIPLVADLAIEGKWMLAAADGGFLVIDLLNHVVTDYVYTDDVDGVAFAHVMGIDKSGDRIFASLGDLTNRFALAMYDFDATTGHVISPTTGLQGDEPLQVLFDGSAGKSDDFPGVFLNEGERISLVQTQASPKKLRIYSGTGNGHLVEVEWSETTDTMTAKSKWHNDGYFSHISDCNVYKTPVPLGFSSFGPTPDFTLRILVTKVRETFEIVSPPDMP